MEVSAPDPQTAAYEERIQLLREAVEEYQGYLVRYVFEYTRHWQDAENIVQELWKYVIVYYTNENIKKLSMLRRKAYLLFLDHYRASKRRPLVLVEELPDAGEAVPTPRSTSTDTNADLMTEFYGQFEKLDLTQAQQSAFWLHARHDLTYKEISKKMDIPVSTLGGWIAKARKQIADQLSEGGN